MELKSKRQTDTSNAEARRAIAASWSRFSPWRSDIAHFNARAERGASARERDEMLARCATIETELLAARTDLIVNLAGSPPRVAGHSRVVDVEKALDNIEQAVSELRQRLAANERPDAGR
jgi:hypothetical protein